MDFCEDYCDSKKVISRLTANFNNLSKIFQDIINLMYEEDPLNAEEEFAL